MKTSKYYVDITKYYHRTSNIYSMNIDPKHMEKYK
jgi:hypothetical protein